MIQIEICFGLTIIACVVLILYLLTRSKGPVSIEKSAAQGNVRLRIKANNDIRRLEVRNLEDGEEVTIVRKGLKKDESVEFILPLAQHPVRVIVQDDGGTHTFDVG